MQTVSVFIRVSGQMGYRSGNCVLDEGLGQICQLRMSTFAYREDCNSCRKIINTHLVYSFYTGILARLVTMCLLISRD